MIIGIDEAGRGPLAGPVSAASVILPDNFPFEILNDSKKMSPALRESVRHVICKGAIAWGIGWASPAEIDEINILKASLLAMKRAFEIMMAHNPAEHYSGALAVARGLEPPEAVVDGLYVPDISIPARAVVKADSKYPAVMAASILAKTARDSMMEIYAVFYPEYGYDKHKGYPTASHRAAIAKYGPSPIQRMTFTVKPLTQPVVQS